MFANALVRRNGDRALRSSDALGGAVLASLPSRVAVLDRIGTIIRVNDAWLDAALVIGADKIAIGANYLDVCRAATQHEPAACEVVHGIESVLAGREPTGFRHEYASSSPAGEHWYELVVEPLRRPAGGRRGDPHRLHDAEAGGGGGADAPRGGGSRVPRGHAWASWLRAWPTSSTSRWPRS